MPYLNRRKFLYLLGSSIGASLVSACQSNRGMMGMMNGGDDEVGEALANATPIPSLEPDTVPNSGFQPDVELVIRAVVSEFSFDGRYPTPLLRYTGEVLAGSAQNLSTIADSYLGPTIRVQRGQNIRIHLINELPVETIIHWHGQHLPEDMDGHPRYTIEPNETYVYEFQVTNRAGTYWYHPHPHQQTGAQAYYGLAGLFIVEDEAEAVYGLPAGDCDLSIILQDRTFTEDNQLQYVSNAHEIMTGFWANTLLVNGRLDHTQNVSSQPYRLRLLNGSNARIYKLAWDDGSPLTVIATDGGLLAEPVTRDYIMLAPAERIELWVDFGGMPNGRSKSLIGLPFYGGNQQEIEAVRFTVEQQVDVSARLPEKFAPLAFIDQAAAINQAQPRTFDFYVDHMTPVVDGRQFDMNTADANETVKLNTVEIWELTNDVNGANGFPHPIHIHGLQFQVIARSVINEAESAWQTIKDGYVDEGWKDTVLLMPGERVQVLLKFSDYPGLFLYHCHNLEHEDAGMMRNYRIEI